MADSNKRS